MRQSCILVTLLAALLMELGCGAAPERVSPLAAVKAAHESYLKENASGYDWFANASDGYGGVPLILMRLLPDLAPEIWGKPEEKFSKFGLFPNPDQPDAPLPLGLSWDSMDPTHPPQQLHPVALTCGACHIGRVRLEGNRYLTTVGGPNTQFDVRMWRKAFELTAHKLTATPQDVAAAAKRLREVISSKPPNYFSQRFDSQEQFIFVENLDWTPWNSLPEHHPIGGINRARQAVYQESRELRWKTNSVQSAGTINGEEWF